MRYYIFKISTDSRYGVLSMKKTASKNVAQSYLKRDIEFTFPERAKGDIPVMDQNYHHTLYEVYEFEGHLPIKEIEKRWQISAEHYRHSVYSRSESLEKHILEYVSKYGVRMKVGDMKVLKKCD